MVKGIVKRGITELVTPGVCFNDKLLNHQQNNFLASVHFEKEQAGIALCDVSTGEFLVAQGSLNYIEKLIQNFKPNEILFEKNKRNELNNLILDNFYSFGIDDWAFKYEFGYESLTNHFETKSLKGFGIEEQHLAISACGAIIHYLNETKHDKLKHINKISRIEEDNYVWLDKFTIRNLELYQTNHENGKSLIDIIDKTVSPMGSRLLKRWLALPLKNINAINERLNAVAFLVSDENKRIDFISFLKEIGDLERLISKVAALRVSPRELVHLKKSLVIISKLKSQIKTSNNSTLQSVAEQLNPCDIICERLQNELNEDAPISVLKGNVFNKGINVELDELRNIAFNGKDYLLQIQKREIE